MFNIASSVRPVVVIDSPAFFKANTFQVAVAATVPPSEKDVPLMVAILSPLESNHQRTFTEVFSGYQELSTDEQEQTILNVGGLGWVSDHYRLTTSNEKKDAYQAAMEEVMIPASALGEIGDDQYPNLVLFADTLEATSPENVQSYFSADCAYLIVEPSPNGKGNSYKIQSRGPVAGEDDTTNPRFYFSSNKTTSKQFAEIEAEHTVQGAFAGNLGGYIGQDSTLNIRFSVSRFFKGKVFNNQGGSVQRESMNKVQVDCWTSIEMTLLPVDELVPIGRNGATP